MADGGGIELDKKTARIGLLIAFLAAVMVFAQTASDNAQSDAITKTVEASDTWAFFQGKTGRKTTIETDAELLELLDGLLEPVAGDKLPPEKAEAVKKAIEKWRATAARYESEPETGEGRKELMERARALMAERDRLSALNDLYDYATGCLQIGILLASTAIITNLIWLAYLGGLVGFAGVVIAALSYLWPGLLI